MAVVAMELGKGFLEYAHPHGAVLRNEVEVGAHLAIIILVVRQVVVNDYSLLRAESVEVHRVDARLVHLLVVEHSLDSVGLLGES